MATARRSCVELIAIIALVACAACSAAGGAGRTNQPTAGRHSNAVLVAGGAFDFAESFPRGTDLDNAKVGDAADTLVAVVSGARKHLDVAQFYIANRPRSRLEPVIHAIEAAARRGVSVRILTEAAFVSKYSETLARLRNQKNITVRSWQTSQAYGGILHAKYVVADGADAFLGSHNFDWRAVDHNVELSVRIRRTAIANRLARIFESDWRAAGGSKSATATTQSEPSWESASFRGSKVRMALVASCEKGLPPGVAWDLPQLIGLITSARREVRIHLLGYKRADRKGRLINGLDSAILSAAKRGVRVKILLSHWSTRPHQMADAKRLAAAPNIEVRLLHIAQDRTGFIPFARVAHSKFMIVDGDKSWLGTNNWSWGYFHEGRNVGVLMRGQGPAHVLSRVFDIAWRPRSGRSSTGAVPVDPRASYPPPRISR